MPAALRVPPNVTVAQAQDRLRLPNLGLPAMLGDGAVAAGSAHQIITATASATPHTKGPWTEIIAALTNESTMLVIHLDVLTNMAGANSSTLLDIGVGAAASETVVVADLPVGYQHHQTVWRIPLTIRAGGRVAVRCQSAAVSKTVLARYTFWRMPNGLRPSTSLVTMGTDAAASKGVSIATAAPNTKSAWTEISAATTEPFGGLMVGVQGDADTALLNGSGILDIGVGTAGNEQVIIPDIPLDIDSGEGVVGFVGPYGMAIPGGVRLSARWSRTDTSNSLDVTLLGLRLAA